MYLYNISNVPTLLLEFDIDYKELMYLTKIDLEFALCHSTDAYIQ